MNRAQLYLWSVLHSLEHVDDRVISNLADQAAADLPIGDLERRRRDMEAPLGAWADRTDLPDSVSYISSLRDHARSERPVGV